jgi:hypothetical protein
MFNIHIGLPGLQEHVFQNSVGWWDEDPTGPYLVSVEEYDAYLAPYLNTRDKARAQSAGYRTTAANFVNSLTPFTNVVLSIPQILGSMSDAIATTTPFPRADGRVARLTKLLSDQIVEFHLLLMNPFDYFFPLPDSVTPDRLSALVSARLSWLGLVERLNRSTLGRPINVWDFDQPGTMALQLRSSVLGPGFEGPMHGEDEDFTSMGSTLEAEEDPDKAALDCLEEIFLLGDTYDHELDQLQSMPGVRLIRSPVPARKS